ncbi:lipase 1 [Hypoxylon crocopeplum]|nr:lipase 1 [Hypoxylon crocopeplum]
MAPSTLEVSSSTGLDNLLPTKDQWYTAPANFEASIPGTVFRVRTVPGGPAVFSNAAAAYHIMYRTTGLRYQPTSLIIPKKASKSSGYHSLLSYQVAYNSSTIDWGSSYRIFQPPLPNAYGIPTDHEKVDIMLDRGWFVAIPDFEGSRAVFGVTVQVGHATLDGIRAVLSLVGIPGVLLPGSVDKFKYAMWGYSGGSIVSEKLAVGFVGAALGGLVSKMRILHNTTNKIPYTGNLILVLLGVMNEYPELDVYLCSRLKTEGPQDVTAGQDIFDYFIGVEWTFGYYGAPGIPLFIYKAIGDEMTFITDTDEHVEQYKRFNVFVQYERNTVGGYVSEIVNGQDRAIEWLAGAFNGSITIDKGIMIQDVAVDIYKPPSH